MEEKKGIRRIRNRKYIQSTLKERTFPSAERNSVKKKKERGEFGEKILLSKKLRGSKHITRFSTELEGNSPESEGKKHDSKLPLNNKRGDWDLVRFLSSSYQTCFKYYSQILNYVYRKNENFLFLFS